MNAGQALNPGEAISDPMVEAAYELLGALEAELVALDQLVLRSRAAMLLAAAGEFTHLRRAGADLDEAATALEELSAQRDLVVNAVAESWHVPLSSAADVISAAPEIVAGELRVKIEQQRALLSEITESIGVAGELSRRSLDLLKKRRTELESPAGSSLTYGSNQRVPAAVVHELA